MKQRSEAYACSFHLTLGSAKYVDGGLEDVGLESPLGSVRCEAGGNGGGGGAARVHTCANISA